MATSGNVPVPDLAPQALSPSAHALEPNTNSDMPVPASAVAVGQLAETVPAAKLSPPESAVSAQPASMLTESGGTRLPSGTLGKDRGNSLPTAGAGGARAGRKSGTLAHLMEERQESNGALSKAARATPGKLQQMMHIMSRAEGKSMLTIEASVRGSLKVWNVDVPSNVALRDVVSSWAGATQQQEGGLEAAHVAGRSGGPALNLDSKIVALRPQLPIRGGRLGLVVSLPERKLEQNSKSNRAQASSKDGLNKIRFSARQTELDLKIFGTRSTTMQDKIASGRYGTAGARGVQLPCGLGDSMKPSPSAPLCGGDGLDWRGPLEARELVVYAREQGDVELFRARLSGPKVHIENWAATAKKFEAFSMSTDGPSKSLTSVPFPVFVPSQGRAKLAHLNWEASHVFGTPTQDMVPGSWPVVIVVVEPDEEEAYRKAWPGALLLVLPKKKRGPSYARWVIQRICTRAFEWKVVNGKRGRIGPLRQLPWCWICDDNLICFFRLVSIRKPSEPARVMVGKRREWGNSSPMFWEAMVAVQQHPGFQKFALCGFLRDDGTATCKTHDWKYDVMSLYKVTLLNNRELRRLNVEYLPGLQKYEDIYFNSEVQRQGGQMMKCQCYCFRASQGSKQEKRPKHRKLRDSPAVLVPGLMDTQHYNALGTQEKTAVKLLSEWSKQREKKVQKTAGVMATAKSAIAAKREQLEQLDGSPKRARHEHADQNGFLSAEERHVA
mmetsp:Transcript_120570/g.240065  ORF Transcript_120570/g.240065 Transcript_120570/m.240065 type:complete len:725 (-) Transcript_120570:209-2383(-)